MKKIFLICVSVVFLSFPAIAEPPDGDGCPWGYREGYGYHGYDMKKGPKCERIPRKHPGSGYNPNSIYTNPYKNPIVKPSRPNNYNLYPNRPKRRYNESHAQYERRHKKYVENRGGSCFISTLQQ